MYETDEELAALQALIDRSFATSSLHLRDIMTDERRLDATRLSTDLDGPCVLNIATVTARGEPRVSAVDGHFLHGRWYFSTYGGSPKVQQLLARPAVSAGYTPKDGYGVFCHGTATRLDPASAEHAMLAEHWQLMYGVTFDSYGEDIAVLRIDPHWLVGFAMTDAEMVEVAAAEQARRDRRAAAGR